MARASKDGKQNEATSAIGRTANADRIRIRTRTT